MRESYKCFDAQQPKRLPRAKGGLSGFAQVKKAFKAKERPPKPGGMEAAL
jgi:hypothetical protein